MSDELCITFKPDVNIMAEIKSSQQLSMVEAICNKYSTDSTSYDYIQVPTKGPGMTDSGHMQLPSILALDDCGIYTAGEEAQIRSYCEGVCELDLTKNHITSWQDVLTILQNLPKLSFLNLTSNPLQKDTWPDNSVVNSFNNVKHLVLNNTGVEWETILKLLSICPCATELHLSLNKYTSVDIPDTFPPFHSLKKLHFTQNKIQHWSELNKIGKAFPNLEVFVGIESDLQKIECDSSIGDCFGKLESLNISQTRVESWDDISAVRNFPSLKGVRLSGIAFLEAIEEKARRQQIIARLPNIERLNGSPVTDSEREDAERAFIRLYMDQDEKPERYQELETIHGKLDHLAHVDLSPRTMMKLNVRYLDRIEKMEINLEQTVKEFKKFLSNFTGVHSSKLLLYHRPVMDGQILDFVLVKLPGKQLWSLRLTEEDEFLVYDKDSEEQERMIMHETENSRKIRIRHTVKQST